MHNDNTMRSEEYWSQYHVEIPEHGFSTAEGSLDHLDWRNRLYPGYIDLMPVNQADDKTVLDYGCGPGNDLVGFGHFSKPRKLFGVDVSDQVIQIARSRVSIHNIDVEFIRIAEKPVHIPIEDSSIDIIHSSGVIHHTPDPMSILQEFRRIIRPCGYAQIMVYNYDSIWMHLFTCYQKIILEGLYHGLSKRDAYEQTMDGDGCPIAICYKPDEFKELANMAGFHCDYLGASMSTTELRLMPSRFDALENRRLNAESREFLYSLEFNEKHWPIYKGHVAGVNACFKLLPA